MITDSDLHGASERIRHAKGICMHARLQERLQCDPAASDWRVTYGCERGDASGRARPGCGGR